jgi:hypothetical protein
MSTTTTERPMDLAIEEVQALLKQAYEGNAAVVPELRQILAANPELWREAGDMTLQAERAWAKLVAGSNLIARESIHLQLAAMKKELAEGSPSPSPLEKLLIDQVALAWLEKGYASAREAQSAEASLSLAQRDHLQKRIDYAQRRLLAAVKQLALVRKLLKPALSALDLAMASVPETAPSPRGRDSLINPRAGVPVPN